MAIDRYASWSRSDLISLSAVSNSPTIAAIIRPAAFDMSRD
jgi:hypothetical protein